MLAVMRRKVKVLSKIALWPVIIAFIGTIFLVWGRGSTGPVSYNAALKIDGEDIADRVYSDSYQQILQYYRMIYGDRFNDTVKVEDLREQALRRVLASHFKNIEAERLGLSVNKDEIRKSITEIKGLHNEQGAFDNSRYQNLLRNQNLTPAEFESRMGQDLLQGKVDDIISAGARVAESEIREEFGLRNDTIDCSYILIDSLQFRETVPTDLVREKEFYESKKEEFKQPDQLKLFYIKIDPRDFEPGINVTDDEAQTYYNTNLDSEFTEKESVHASHILVRVDAKASDEMQAEAKTKIDAIAEELKNGADFAEVAKVKSEDPGSGPKGGDLGFFQRGRMVKAFEDAAFALEVGKTSDPIKSDFGWHIIQVHEKKPQTVKNFDEVKMSIITKLKSQTAKERAAMEGEKLYDKFFQVRDFHKITADTNYTIQETEFFNKDGFPKEIGYSAEFKEYVAIAKDEVISPVIVTGSGVYLMTYSGERPAYVPEYEEIKDQVAEKYKDEEAKRLVKEKCQLIKDRISTSDLFETVAGEESLKIEKTGEMRRNSRYVRGLGQSEEFVKEAFKLEAGGIGPIIETEKGCALFKVEVKKGFDDKLFQEQKDQIKQDLIRQKQGDLVENWLNTAIKNSAIELSSRYSDLEHVIYPDKKQPEQKAE